MDLTSGQAITSGRNDISISDHLAPIEAITCLPVALLQVVQALRMTLFANVGLVDRKVLASTLLR